MVRRVISVMKEEGARGADDAVGVDEMRDVGAEVADGSEISQHTTQHNTAQHNTTQQTCA